MFTNEYWVYCVNQCVSLGVTYRSMGRKIALETWMTQRQLHHRKVHPCLGKSSPEQHPWSSRQDLQAASHAGKSPTGRLVIWEKSPLNNCVSVSNLGGIGQRPHASLWKVSRLWTLVYIPSLLSLSSPSWSGCFSWRKNAVVESTGFLPSQAAPLPKTGNQWARWAQVEG